MMFHQPHWLELRLLKSNEGTVPPSQILRKEPGSLMSVMPGKRNVGKLLLKSDNFEHHVNPHNFEKPKMAMNIFKILSKISSIRKLWEEKTGLENKRTVSGVSTSPICKEPILMENQPPIFGHNQRRGGD